MIVCFLNKEVEKFVYRLQVSAHAKTIRMIERIEKYGHELGMPYSKQMGLNLFELRIRDKQEVRIFYCFWKNEAILLHGFLKKTQKTPQRELKKAHVLLELLKKSHI